MGYENSLLRLLREEKEKTKEEPISSEEYARQGGLETAEEIEAFHERVRAKILAEKKPEEDDKKSGLLEADEIETLANEYILKILNDSLPQAEDPRISPVTREEANN